MTTEVSQVDTHYSHSTAYLLETDLSNERDTVYTITVGQAGARLLYVQVYTHTPCQVTSDQSSQRKKMAQGAGLVRRVFSVTLSRHTKAVTCIRGQREYNLGSLVGKDMQESLRKNPFYEQYKDKLQDALRYLRI